MNFTEWWETKGLEEYRARCKNVVVEPTPDGEWIAKHCAWAAWSKGMLVGAEIMVDSLKPESRLDA